MFEKLPGEARGGRNMKSHIGQIRPLIDVIYEIFQDYSNKYTPDWHDPHRHDQDEVY